MTIRKIATIGHPVLRQPARALTLEELSSATMQTLIDDMIETMRDANGAGIAANQVYEPVQLCILEVRDNPRYPYQPHIPLTVLVNPKLEWLSEQTFDNYEGCLSVPNLRGLVPRHVGVRALAWDRHGESIEREIWGITAGVYQHECDHLHGTLFVDKVRDPKTLCTWEAFERYQREHFMTKVQEIVAQYGS